MEPITTLLSIGAVSAFASLASAITSWVRRRPTAKVSVKIGNKDLQVSSTNRQEIEEAVQSLQKVLASIKQ